VGNAGGRGFFFFFPPTRNIAIDGSFQGPGESEGTSLVEDTTGPFDPGAAYVLRESIAKIDRHEKGLAKPARAGEKERITEGRVF